MTQGIEYEFEIRKSPTFSYIEVALKKDQVIQCEGGTMIFFDPTLEISTKGDCHIVDRQSHQPV